MTKPVLSFLGETRLELGSGPEEAFGAWRLRRGPDDIAWALFDCPGTGTNTVSIEGLADLGRLLDRLEDDRPAALVLRSAKAGGFAAGADIGQFAQADDPETVEPELRRGHDVLDRLEALGIPTIAVVHGYALGAGFEIALACDHRIGIEGCRFGFPEVQLGLHPGLGGTFRLTGLIEPTEAMTMMLTGKPAHDAKAKSLGIVDELAEERHVDAAVHALAQQNEAERRAGLRDMLWDLGATRHVAAGRMRTKTEEKAPKAHYPAPHALIDLWEEHGGDRGAMQAAEISSFARLLTSDTARELIRVFFLREGLKGRAKGDSAIRRVHVVGAGTMGAEIAGWCAIRGHRVTLGDVALEPLGRAVQSTASVAADKHLSGIEMRDALDRLMPDPAGDGIASADLVIEAAPEKPELKREILGSILNRCRKDAIIATNSSSLDLEELAEALGDDRGRFAGLHFFNPVSKMQLVEVVTHDATDPDTVDALGRFVGGIGRLPAVVGNYPGFLVNRILTPYLLEALLMHDEGMAPARVDAAAEAFGMAMGPLEVADRVGLDICLHVADSLRDRLDMPVPEPPEWLTKRVSDGHLGQKTGRGIFEWQDGKPQKGVANEEATDAMQERLILPMLNASVECLRKRVVAEADTLDAAMIFAAGFAPFRGGPMRYSQALGKEHVVARLTALAQEYGPRFAPDEGWDDIA